MHRANFHVSAGLFLGLLLLFQGCAPAATLPSSAQANASAWLTLIDNQQYEQSWEDSASVFRKSITAQGWAAAARGARNPLGTLQERTQQDAEIVTNPPGAPDGSYWFITYATQFADKQSARETITLFQETDGAWRVAGYFVQ